MDLARTKSRSKRQGAEPPGPKNQAFRKNHHRYAHGLKTKEIIIIRKLATEINKSLKDLVQKV